MTVSIFAANTAVTPPVANVLPKEVALNGDRRVDNYFWLRDKTNPEVIKYLEAENEYTNAVMKPLDPLREKLYNEILSHVKETDLSATHRLDDYYYYTRTEKGKQYTIYCRKKGSLNASEEILLDANELAAGHNYFAVGNFSVSPDHTLLAFSTNTTGDETYTTQVKDLTTGKLLPDSIPDTYYTMAWASDNKTFFYTVLDAAKRPYKVFRHELGSNKETLVYHEKDERFNLTLGKTNSREYILIDIHSSLTSETRYIPADHPRDTFEPILPREQDVEYSVSHHGDSFYVTTNEGAKTFRLMRVPMKNPGKSSWHEVIPQRPAVTLLGTDTFADHLVIIERDNGLVRLRVRSFQDGTEYYVDFPEPVYSVFPTQNVEYKTNLLRFSYTSLVTPSSVYDFDMVTRRRELKKQQEVLGGYDPELFSSARVYAVATDGVKVPISLVYKKGTTTFDGKAPMLLSAYGAYGIPMEPTFNSDRLSLLDRGFVCAIAHIRGGGDLGRPWHDDGKLLNKRNTFTDFIAAAQYLVDHRYTSPDRLAIMGGSAGGLLMGAVTNMRPDLFRAVIAKVPFVDVLNTMLDPTLPLTVTEYEEWGNPEEKKFYQYMRTYSPYDNVEPKRYPIMLVTGGLNDPRVSYWEPAKWVAKLRATKKDDNLLLLKMNMGAGHGGPSGRYARMKETAFDYAFILNAIGVSEPRP
jgi:oligopeptidase B